MLKVLFFLLFLFVSRLALADDETTTDTETETPTETETEEPTTPIPGSLLLNTMYMIQRPLTHILKEVPFMPRLHYETVVRTLRFTYFQAGYVILRMM
jgi:hypothetical protein